MLSVKVNKLLVLILLCFSNFNCECGEAAKTSNIVKEPISLIIENGNSFETSINKYSSSLYRNICRYHIEEYKSKLQEEELWAMKMFDSSTKFPEGLLMGNVVQLGNYDECLSITNIISKFGTFDGKYCLATVGIQREEIKRNNNYHMPTFLGNLMLYIPESQFISAICIPSSCNSTEVEDILTNSLEEVLLRKVTVNVENDNCETNTPRTLQIIDFITIAILLLLVLLVGLSTVYHLRSLDGKGERNSLFLTFSAYSNVQKLLSTSQKDDRLNCLHGMRFISTGWIVLAHRYMISSLRPSINSNFVNDFVKDVSRFTIINCTLATDTFLLMSGLLLTHTFLKERQHGKPFNLLTFYIHRYMRLAPVLGVVILLQVSLFKFSGSGPLWSNLSREPIENCERNWWLTMLFVNNYVNVNKMCLEQSWYLSIDMQLYWLSPIILIPLWKKPKWVKYILPSLFLIGWLLSLLSAFAHFVEAGIWTSGKEINPSLIQNVLYPTHTRFIPWLLGVTLSYYLHRRKQDLPQFIVLSCWLLSNVFLIGIIFAAYPFQQPDYEFNNWESGFYLSLFRISWALGVAWIILACQLGYGGAVNLLLSWKVFIPLSRMSYIMYLSNMLILYILTNGIRAPQHLSDNTIIPQFMSDMLICMGAAIILGVLIEIPFIELEKRWRKT